MPRSGARPAEDIYVDREDLDGYPWTGNGPDEASKLHAIRSLDQYVVTLPEYLWQPRLEVGNLNLLVGDSGVTKTWVGLAIAASGSRGWHLPGDDGRIPEGYVEPWSTVILTAENDPGVLRFRIDRLGGDPSRIHIWDTAVAPLPALTSLSVLGEVLADINPRLLIVDPIQSVLGTGTDMNKANEVRPVLDGLVGLSRKHRCAPLVLMHLNKATTLSAKHRILGSIDFGATARSIMLVAPDPADPSRRVLVHLKASNAREAPTLHYAIDGDGGQVEFGWLGVSDLTADEVLGSGVRSDRADTRVKEAEQMLREALKDGPVPKEIIVEQAKDVGIGESTLKRAFANLRGVYRSGGFPRRTQWSLPQREQRHE